MFQYLSQVLDKHIYKFQKFESVQTYTTAMYILMVWYLWEASVKQTQVMLRKKNMHC